jgi:predicted metalloprotease with PDZ domain
MNVMKRIIPVLLLFITSLCLNAQEDGYKLNIDIDEIKNDQVRVTLYPPQLDSGKTTYNMPKIIPGTYSVSDFGQFVEDLQAISTSGDTLEVAQLDENRWSISSSENLDYITYLVNDSYDEPGGAGIFEPSGTNIDDDENVLLNLFGFVGYFDGAKHRSYQLVVEKPGNFYGETSLPRKSSTDSTDTFLAKDYFQLHDCPILYAEPDTASVNVAGARIAIAVYSPTDAVSANDIMEVVQDLFPAAANYLGGELPVDQYTILVYLNKGMGGTGAFGALEHNTSTVFYLPEAPVSALRQTLRDVTAHEFFHIVTPLSIHSEEIDDYDFVNPKMSKHLWLYEGCTEYAAQHVQVKEGLMSMDDFLDVMQQKMVAASGYDSGIAFTEMSKKALDEHADQYLNVYQQGALIGMAIDLKLLSLSNGEYGIQNLMSDLSQKYGVDKPFKDDELFGEIGQISGYPEMTDFLERHVAGTEPLPFESLLANAGIMFRDSLTEKSVSGGNIAIGYNPKTERLVVATTEGMDEFGQALGFEVGDELVSWNGRELNLDNIQDVLNEYKKTTNPGDKVKVEVAREVKEGKKKTVKLKAKAIEIDRTRRNVLEVMDDPTTEQLAIRKAWINV